MQVKLVFLEQCHWGPVWQFEIQFFCCTVWFNFTCDSCGLFLQAHFALSHSCHSVCWFHHWDVPEAKITVCHCGGQHTLFMREKLKLLHICKQVHFEGVRQDLNDQHLSDCCTKRCFAFFIFFFFFFFFFCLVYFGDWRLHNQLYDI